MRDGRAALNSSTFLTCKYDPVHFGFLAVVVPRFQAKQRIRKHASWRFLAFVLARFRASSISKHLRSSNEKARDSDHELTKARFHRGPAFAALSLSSFSGSPGPAVCR